ncbi:hypothetical protein ACE6H2_001447 [Prunus campanulata]
MRGHDRINTFIPDELILEMFRRLDSKPSHDACSLVCKRWLALERLSRTSLRICATVSPNLVVDPLADRFRNGRRRGTDIAGVSSVMLHCASEKNGSPDPGSDSCSLSDAELTAIGEGFPKLEKLSLI